MSLPSGARIGPYEVISQIGVGGMGEVYRATDTNLKRAVAIKVLPESVAGDSDRLARFQREAEVLAALNHPNIAQIYGLERSGSATALVMELVEGPTLADRIAHGAIPFDEALAIAKQITEALEAAHEQGIIHRDLKPANIKVRPDGTVKVLDFGLAKAMEPVGAMSPSVSQSPTITTPAMTQMGMILGTAAYMSPEQAKGKPADKRSDVWAFGCVLYEMLTGKRAFDGDDMVDVLGAVARLEPDWTALPEDVPSSVRTLAQRCVVKDRRARIADIAVAQFLLAEHGTLAPVGRSVPAMRPVADRRAFWAAPIVTALVVGGGAWVFKPAPAAVPQPLVQFTVPLPDDQRFSAIGRQVVVISPDGAQIVYVANNRLYRRALGEAEAQVIPGSDLNPIHPAFSPDGAFIAFFTQSDGTLKRIPVTGGTAFTIGRADNPIGMSWGPDGILFGRPDGIYRVSPDGGAPEQVVKIDVDQVAHGPQILPDGTHVLFTLGRNIGANRWETSEIVVQSLESGERTTVVKGGSDGRYLPTGHLVYAVSGTLFAVPFDPVTRTATSTPVPVLVGVRRAAGAAGGTTGTAQVSVSDNGALVYVPGPAVATSTARSLVVSDRGGSQTPLRLPPGNYVQPRASPDGSQMAVGIEEGQEANVWVYDLAGARAIRRLTLEGRNRYPVWSADGLRVTFQSDRQGDLGIFWQRADGSSAAERLTTAPEGTAHIPEAWSRDGKHLLYAEQKGATLALFSYSPADKTSVQFGGVESAELTGAGFSPDGRWIVYAATKQAGGTRSPDRGIFIQPFPATGARYQVPKTGVDFHPTWSSDATEVFYVGTAARPLVSVAVETKSGVTFGAPSELAEALPRAGLLSTDVRGYDLLPGGRFLSLIPSDQQDDEPARGQEIRVLLNWTEELKRLVPPD